MSIEARPKFKQYTINECEKSVDRRMEKIYIQRVDKPIDVNVKIKRFLTLDGRIEERVSQVGDGSIIKMFDKTPYPVKPEDVVCPHFLELKWANGCYFDCAWCYLNGTFRYFERGKKPYFKDREKIKQHLMAFFEKSNGRREILNTGELSDSFLSENTKQPFSKFIIPIFEGQNKHKVLFLTKSTEIGNLLEIRNHKQTIISFSLNAEDVAKRWEKAPWPADRIEAARKVSEAGYEVRIRIDPLVPITNWQNQYIDLIDKIFCNFIPERITLGSLRGLQSTINNCKDKSWAEYLTESSNWGKKIEFSLRYKMYLTIIEYLKQKYDYGRIAFCKETMSMWDSLGMNYKEMKCNCTI